MSKIAGPSVDAGFPLSPAMGADAPRCNWSPFHPDARANDLIQSHLQQVVEGIHAHCGETTILLTGSFGRGEGSVLVGPDQVQVLSDVEVAVVSSNPRVRGPLRSLSESLTLASGIETCLFWVRPDSLRRWRIKSLSFGDQPLTVKIYDILAGSRLLSDDDPHLSIPNAALIPRWEGMRLVFNRMIEALLVDSGDPEPAVRAKATSKLILACSDALLIDRGLYHISLKERVARLHRAWPARTGTLGPESARALELGDWAMQYKLQPHSITALEAEAVRMKAADLADQTMRYLLERELGLRFSNYIDGMKRYLRSPRVRRDYIDYRLGRLTNPLYPNLIYAAKLVRTRWRPRLRSISYSLLPWDQVIYACGAILFHAKAQHGDHQAEYLDTVDELLRPLVHPSTATADPTHRHKSQTDTVCALWKALLG